MPEVIVIAEGQTEELFIKQVVSPALKPLGIFVKPQLLNTSKVSKGGAVSFDRLKINARNTLRQHSGVILTTFIDLYALDTSFPAFTEAKTKPDVYARLICLQDALRSAIVKEAGCRPERFLPYIQPYEYEGLLFSDINALATVEPAWNKSRMKLEEVRKSFETPEHINDGFETKPSKRLEKLLLPKYKKTRHGPLIAKCISLEIIERECGHFRGWIQSLRSLDD